MRFDKVGAFKFSFEPGTTAEALGDPIPDGVKEERFNRLMEKQQKISLELIIISSVANWMCYLKVSGRESRSDVVTAMRRKSTAWF